MCVCFISLRDISFGTRIPLSVALCGSNVIIIISVFRTRQPFSYSKKTGQIIIKTSLDKRIHRVDSFISCDYGSRVCSIFGFNVSSFAVAAGEKSGHNLQGISEK